MFIYVYNNCIYNRSKTSKTSSSAGSDAEEKKRKASKIKGPWASVGPLSSCFIEVMHNEF